MRAVTGDGGTSESTGEGEAADAGTAVDGREARTGSSESAGSSRPVGDVAHALARAEGGITTLLDAIAQPAFVLSSHDCILYANPIARRLFSEPPTWHRRGVSLPSWVQRLPLAWRGMDLVVEVIDPICDSVAFAPVAPWATRAGLPPRLARIAACILQGMSYKEAGAALGISHDTARTYARLLLRRTRVRSRGELCVLVRRWMSG